VICFDEQQYLKQSYTGLLLLDTFIRHDDLGCQVCGGFNFRRFERHLAALIYTLVTVVEGVHSPTLFLTEGIGGLRGFRTFFGEEYLAFSSLGQGHAMGNGSVLKRAGIVS
jgi:hypothetical protein